MIYALEDDLLHDDFHTFTSSNTKIHDVVYHIHELSHTGKAYTDITGRFPYRSSRENQYIFVGYHFEANTILVTPIKNRQAATITVVWQK